MIQLKKIALNKYEGLYIKNNTSENPIAYFEFNVIKNNQFKFWINENCNLIQAEKYFKKAIELGLNMDMDLAVAKLNLAGVALSRGRELEATNLISEVKKLDKQGMLKEQIAMMKEQMKKI